MFVLDFALPFEPPSDPQQKLMESRPPVPEKKRRKSDHGGSAAAPLRPPPGGEPRKIAGGCRPGGGIGPMEAAGLRKESAPFALFWVNYNDLTRPHPTWRLFFCFCFLWGIAPEPPYFRLVKYYTSPRLLAPHQPPVSEMPLLKQRWG